MLASVYGQILKQVKGLSRDDRLRLLADIETFIREEDNQESEHNVTEFRGFAKELWKGVDVKKYLEEERNSWDG